MTRSIPADRLDKLAACATEVFIRNGYRRTQMADIAEALGVAKGTVYLYVESKEALLDLALRHADDDGPVPMTDGLPLKTPSVETTMAFARQRLAAAQTPVLLAALQGDAPADVASELASIVREAFRLCSANRRTIKLVDRCAPDRPELAALWYGDGREGLMALLAAYIEARPGLAAGYSDPNVVTRMIVELIAFWAVHRHWDPHPQEIAETTAEDTAVMFITQALQQRGSI
jgi:AcrR family transcriptional regulator